MKEVQRIKNFSSGKATCKCGETFTLWFNGGELDAHQCKCGLHYKTEAFRYDLVIYQAESEQPRTTTEPM